MKNGTPLIQNESAGYPGYYNNFLSALLLQAPRPGCFPQTEIGEIRALFLSSPKGQAVLKALLRKAILESNLDEYLSPKFETVVELVITVPEDYNPRTFLAEFHNRYPGGRHPDEKAYSVTGELIFSDPRWANAPSGRELKPGKKYRAVIVKLNEAMYYDAFIPEFCRNIGAIQAGPHALFLAWQQQRGLFPENTWTFAGELDLDNEATARIGYEAMDDWMIPAVCHQKEAGYHGPEFHFGLGYATETPCPKGYCVLCLLGEQEG